MNEKTSKRSLLRLLLFCVVVAMIFLWALFPVVRNARLAAKRMQCACGQLCLAFHNYHDTYGVLPPAYTVDEEGTPRQSWRVLLLPFMEEHDLYDRIRLDEPWNSEYNRQFHDKRPSCYACPADVKGKDDCHTNYLRIIGPDTLTSGPDTVSLEELGYTDRTILYVESTRPVCWMAPEDLDLRNDRLKVDCDSDDPRTGIGSRHGGMALIRMVDGTYDYVTDTTPEKLLLAGALKKTQEKSETKEMDESSSPDFRSGEK